jgi:type VII secretion protein EccB
MPSTPTTKSQVQAYKFVIRRMQSALVRKDAVMLHDPMRTHSRATLVGVALAVIGLAGFLIYGLISPKPTPPNSEGIVISKESGAVYVLTGKGDNRRLIPTFNLASARLIMYAQQLKAAQSAGGGQGNTASVNASVQPAKAVDEEYLKGIPKWRLTGIPDGPDVIPSSDDMRATGQWGVCDNFARDTSLNDPTIGRNISTTVLGGMPSLGDSLKPDQGLLVSADGGRSTYLIYRTPSSANKPDSDAVRAKLDFTKDAVKSTFNPSDTPARAISPGLLDAIPAVQDLDVPDIQGLSKPSDFNPEYKVGSVLEASRTGQAARYYVVLQHGLQQVSKAAADVIRSDNSFGQQDAIPVTLDSIANVDKGLNEIDVSQFPDQPPELLNPNRFPTTCLGWRADMSDPQQPGQRTQVTVGQRLPINEKDGIRLGSPNPDGIKVDRFYMPPGRAAVVRSAASAADFGRGPIFIVSDRGVRYGVPDTKTAQALGVTKFDPAPEAIMRLLPTGTELNTQLAQRTFDSVLPPDSNGSYPQGQQPSGAQGVAEPIPVPGG